MELSLAISILALLFSVLGWVLASVGLSIIVGLKNSTHTMQWVPMEQPTPEKAKEVEDAIYKTFGSNKQDLKDYMTPFSGEEGLKKKTIFDDGELL